MAAAEDPEDRDMVEDTRRRGLELVQRIVQEWSSKYRHYTRCLGLDDTMHYEEFETLFSLPSNAKPVAEAVVHVYFKLDAARQTDAPHELVTFRFENDSVRHKVLWHKQNGGYWTSESSLTLREAESWLDRLIENKLKVRQMQDLSTDFEVQRMQPEEDLGDEEDLEDASATSEATHEDVREKPQVVVTQEGLKLADLLANIFDAADEGHETTLTHKEVADLLYATTTLNLTAWDIQLLLATQHEDHKGLIQYQPFVMAAPEIVEALRHRRKAYAQRIGEGVEVSNENIELCYGDEFEETVKQLKELFEHEDHEQTGWLRRHDFHQCLHKKAERLSPQEIRMVMQRMEEDEYGRVPYETLGGQLLALRRDALHNALVETDVSSLWKHVVLLLRKHGLTEEAVMPVWELREILLNCDQLCLSRMQVHLILCILKCDLYGWVDVRYFLQIVCTVVPRLFDARLFVEKATAIAKERADAQAKAELEELQGLTGGGMRALAQKKGPEDEDEEEESKAVDRETVEKTMIHVFQVLDEKWHRGNVDAQDFLRALRSSPEDLREDERQLQTAQQQLAGLQLSSAELLGFCAEAHVLDDQTIEGQDHVKKWVPILFEIRRSKLLELSWESMADQLIDLAPLEQEFPLLPPRPAVERTDSKRGSVDSRRGSGLRSKGAQLSVTRGIARMSVLRQNSQRPSGSPFAQAVGRMGTPDASKRRSKQLLPNGAPRSKTRSGEHRLSFGRTATGGDTESPGFTPGPGMTPGMTPGSPTGANALSKRPSKGADAAGAALPRPREVPVA